MFQNIGEMAVLLWRTLQSLPLAWRQRRKVFDQLFEIGNASLLMACILSLFIGGVIALQTGPVLAERGLGSYMGRLVGLSNSMRCPQVWRRFPSGHVNSKPTNATTWSRVNSSAASVLVLVSHRQYPRRSRLLASPVAARLYRALLPRRTR